MDDLDDFSVLDYARSRGIATDHLKLNPSELLTRFCSSEQAHIFDEPFTELTSEAFDLEISAWANNAKCTARRNEKLELDKSGTKFLASVLKEATSLQAGPDVVAKNEFDLFQWPKYSRKDDLKIEVPLLTSERETEMQTFGKRPDPVALLNTIASELMDQERNSMDEGLDFPDYFWELPSMFERDPNDEKLEASRDTARFLHGALRHLDERKHEKGGAKLSKGPTFDMMPFQRRPFSPLYIETEEQDETCASQTYHYGNSADADDDWILDTGRPEIVRKTPPPRPRKSAETETIVPIECSNTDASPSMNCDAAVTEETELYSSSHWTGLPVGDEIVNASTVYSPGIKKAEIEVEHFSGLAKPPSPVSHPAMTCSGTLGTLSAFMQTRRQKIKRRKLDNESRYFERLFGSSTNLNQADEEKRAVKSAEPSKPSSSPLVIQEVQTSHQYPPFPPKEPPSPIILILSTHLLRTDSTLVRALENMSSSHLVRLIFRDYTAYAPSKHPVSNVSCVVEEADLIISPTTGILLVNFHETTQKYLPGQGLPGIESPLKARIARAAPRYEILYVLIRSPIQTSMKMLSSIRNLTAFCVSLIQVCNIKVLLVPADHVLEWILSIAAKHSTSLPITPAIHEKTERSATSPYLDEQTQWEVFLRYAGFNPFAAQSVLGMLKASLTQDDECADGDASEVSELSTFIEMSSATRREMFQEIIGERILQKVEKALEMDWQVDWAVDLA